MKARPDITVTLNLHREGALAQAALASFIDLVRVARSASIEVETQAILDRPDEHTRHIVAAHGSWIDIIEEVSFGDLGLARNAGTCLAQGRFLSFLDGDDLWGEDWLRAAFSAATETALQEAIWHPEYLYVFGQVDSQRRSEAGMRLMQSSDTPDFNPAILLFGNTWSANVVASRELFRRFPYCPVDRDRGTGIEDWSWNLETVQAGIPHRVVSGTVHLIRKKEVDSLDQQNAASELLPRMPRTLQWGR